MEHHKTVRYVENGRLVYYRSKADAKFWDTHWRKHISPEFYTSASQGNLDWFEKPFTRYLPKSGSILEAGCGLGQYVMALQVRGYEVEGVEWGDETVKSVRTIYPELPVQVGDVTRLTVPDGYYQGYISLGVVEHRREGPGPFLHEAYRVLAPGGIALISVPYFHSLRRLKAWLGLYRKPPTNNLEFYQYAFTAPEFIDILQCNGFEIIDRIPYDGLKGIKDEIPWLNWLVPHILQWRGGWRLRTLLQYSALGHMLLVVCRKREASL